MTETDFLEQAKASSLPESWIQETLENYRSADLEGITLPLELALQNALALHSAQKRTYTFKDGRVADYH